MEAEVAVVTGGAGGLGRLITRKLAQQGFVVAIADIDREAAIQLSAELAGSGCRCQFIKTDASDSDAIRRVMAKVASLGAVKVLINNAGGWLAGPEFPESEQWRRCLDLMTEQGRDNSGGLVDPDLVVDTVVDLALDQRSAGRIVVLRAHMDPYDVGPGSLDPPDGSRLSLIAFPRVDA